MTNLYRADDSERPPDLNDMFVAGLELRDAVALEREIKTRPEIEPSHWWAIINSARTSRLMMN